MPQLIVAAAGAAIGSVLAPGIAPLLFGLTGTQIGWAVGGLIGNAMFAPTQKSTGPRLNDLTIGGSSYGAIIPYIEGRPRISGQIVWASNKQEITTVERHGKGGGGSQVTSFTYQVDLLIELTDCVIFGVSRIWSGGDLVFNARSGAANGTTAASNNTPVWDRMTVYTGGPSQLPDPDYEAAVGINNAPAYRGRGTVFIKGLKLGQSGQLPNLTFEVVRHGIVGIDNGTVYETVSRVYNTFPAYLAAPYDFADTTEFKYGTASLAAGYYVSDTPTNEDAVTQARMRRQMVPDEENEDAATNFTLDFWVRVVGTPADPVAMVRMKHPSFIGPPFDPLCHYGLVLNPDLSIVPAIYQNFGGMWGASASFADPVDAEFPSPSLFSGWSGDITHNPVLLTLNTWYHVALYRYESRIFTSVGADAFEHKFLNSSGASLPKHSYGFPDVVGGDYYWPMSNAVHRYADGIYRDACDVFGDRFLAMAIGPDAVDVAGSPFQIDAVRWSNESARFVPGSAPGPGLGYEEAMPIVDEWTTTLYNFDSYPTVESVDPKIDAVVARLCERAGLTADQYEVGGLFSLPETPVVVHAMVISQISSTRTILEMLMACYFFDCVLSNKLYFWYRGGAVVQTLDYDDLGWVASGQSFAEQLQLKVANELELPAQLALTYNAIDSDYQTDTQYSDRLTTSQENTSVVQVPLGFTASEAKIIADARLTDSLVSLLTSQVALNLSHSLLEPTDVVSVTDIDGSIYRMRLLRRQDADCVLQFDVCLDDATVFTQLGITVGGTPSQTVVAAISDTDMELLDIPILRDEDNSAGIYVPVKGMLVGWHGATLYHSLEGVTYVLDATYTAQAVFGLCTTTMPNWSGGTVFDEMSSVTVDVGLGELESVSREALLLDNTLNGAVVGNELVQFRTATLQSEGVYKLSSFIRGRRGTEWAMTGHRGGERFVLLTAAGMRFIPLQLTDLASERKYKAVSAGQRLSAVIAENITPMGVGLKPFSPVDVRVNREGANPVVTWLPRTRLAVRVGGVLPQSIPMGEATEAYVVYVYTDDTFTALFDTINTVTPSATVVGGADPLAVRIAQISASVGAGYFVEAVV